MHNYIKILILLLLIIFVRTSVPAYLLVKYRLNESYDKSSLVFIGMLDKKITRETIPQKVCNFKVEKYYKGDGSSEITIHILKNNGVVLDSGKSYLVYAYLGIDNKYYTNGSFDNKLKKLAGRDIHYLETISDSPIENYIYGNIKTFNKKPITIKLFNDRFHFRTRTDSVGDFSFENLPRGTYYYHVVVPKGFTLATVRSHILDIGRIPFNEIIETVIPKKRYKNIPGYHFHHQRNQRVRH